jgi:hypothetical protein
MTETWPGPTPQCRALEKKMEAANGRFLSMFRVLVRSGRDYYIGGSDFRVSGTVSPQMRLTRDNS